METELPLRFEEWKVEVEKRFLPKEF